jgi:hypothetical protein
MKLSMMVFAEWNFEPRYVFSASGMVLFDVSDCAANEAHPIQPCAGLHERAPIAT